MLEEVTYGSSYTVRRQMNLFPDPDAVAKAIQKAARSSYRLPKTVNASVNQVLSISIASIKALETQIKELALTARKLVQLVFVLLGDNRLYRPAK